MTLQGARACCWLRKDSEMREYLIEDLQLAAPVLQEFLGDAHPACAIVLGSGLNSFADELERKRFLKYADVPYMKVSTGIGHKGRFVLGNVPGTEAKVLCMQGRLHGYEGFTAQEVAYPIWLMHEVGIDTLVTTNAAGSLNPDLHVGDFCLMADHINLTGRNPIVGVEPAQIAERYVPMVGAYDEELRGTVLDIAQREGVRVGEGVYLALLGPSFETPAEIRMFRTWGADTVAMSVVEEVIAARHVGMRVVGMSLVTNMASGVEGGDPQSDDILAVADDAREPFSKLMRGFVRYLHDCKDR